MPALPNELAEVMDRLEHTQQLDEGDIADAIRSVGKPLKEKGDVPLAIQAEWMAFDFSERCPDEGEQRGTYFGPSVGYSENGKWYEWPHIQLVTAEILEYWKARSAEAKHPIMRARYADLVCDITPKVCNTRADIGILQIAIDAYTEIVERQLCKYWQKGIPKAERALNQAISLNDRTRTNRLRDAILALDTAQPPDVSGRGIAFDLLMYQKNVELTDTQIQILVAKQEEILKTGLEHAEKGDPSFLFGSERIANRLAMYHKKRSQQEEVCRVLGTYSALVLAISSTAPPPIAAAWLRKAFELLSDFHCSKIGDKVAVALREKGIESMAEMQTVTTTLTIPRDKLNELTDTLLAGSIEDAIGRIAQEFIPDRERADAGVKQLMNQSPFLAMIKVQQVDSEGRVVSTAGSVADDLALRVLQQLAADMQKDSFVLRHVMQSFIDRFKVAPEMVVEQLDHSPVFPKDRKPVLTRGIDAYLAGDHIVAAHLLIPQIEHALRQLIILCGRPVLKTNRNGGTDFRILDDLLRDEGILEVLGEQTRTYFRLVLSDRHGWNLRNDLLHGIMNPSELGWGSSDRLLHLVLILGRLRYAQASQTPKP